MYWGIIGLVWGDKRVVLDLDILDGIPPGGSSEIFQLHRLLCTPKIPGISIIPPKMFEI